MTENDSIRSAIGRLSAVDGRVELDVVEEVERICPGCRFGIVDGVINNAVLVQPNPEHRPLRIHWHGIGNHNHHLITPSDMEAWCAATGYTDPFHQENRWWAFPPNGVMPVEVGQQVRGWESES